MTQRQNVDPIPKRSRTNAKVKPVLIDDPEPVETEYFLAEGAADAEIVSDEDLQMESAALAALADEVEGDMAAMPEIMEE